MWLPYIYVKYSSKRSSGNRWRQKFRYILQYQIDLLLQWISLLLHRLSWQFILLQLVYLDSELVYHCIKLFCCSSSQCFYRCIELVYYWIELVYKLFYCNIKLWYWKYYDIRQSWLSIFVCYDIFCYVAYKV